MAMKNEAFKRMKIWNLLGKYEDSVWFAAAANPRVLVNFSCFPCLKTYTENVTTFCCLRSGTVQTTHSAAVQTSGKTLNERENGHSLFTRLLAVCKVQGVCRTDTKNSSEILVFPPKYFVYTGFQFL